MLPLTLTIFCSSFPTGIPCIDISNCCYLYIIKVINQALFTIFVTIRNALLFKCIFNSVLPFAVDVPRDCFMFSSFLDDNYLYSHKLKLILNSECPSVRLGTWDSLQLVQSSKIYQFSIRQLFFTILFTSTIKNGVT